MTLKRTIHRREARKRAKVRKPLPRGQQLIVPSWLIRDRLAELAVNLRTAALINREF